VKQINILSFAMAIFFAAFVICVLQSHYRRTWAYKEPPIPVRYAHSDIKFELGRQMPTGDERELVGLMTLDLCGGDALQTSESQRSLSSDEESNVEVITSKVNACDRSLNLILRIWTKV
jgi:hypothetical protein